MGVEFVAGSVLAALTGQRRKSMAFDSVLAGAVEGGMGVFQMGA